MATTSMSSRRSSVPGVVMLVIFLVFGQYGDGSGDAVRGRLFCVFIHGVGMATCRGTRGSYALNAQCYAKDVCQNRSFIRRAFYSTRIYYVHDREALPYGKCQVGC